MRRLVRFIRFSKVDVATLPANLLDAVVSAAYLAITPELKMARHSASIVRLVPSAPVSPRTVATAAVATPPVLVPLSASPVKRARWRLITPAQVCHAPA